MAELAGGVPKRISINGKEYDPTDTSWTITANFVQYKKSSTTYRKTYFTGEPMPGSITGQIKATKSFKASEITGLFDAPVIIELANGVSYSGTMTYEGEGSKDESTGDFALTLTGNLTEIPAAGV